MAVSDSSRSGRPYIVVSADTHAAPENIEKYLSYVDPGYRAEIAEFGSLDLAVIRANVGHVDVEVEDEADPVRRAARRKAAGMRVDIGAVPDWFEHYTSDAVFADDCEGRRLAALEREGIHAEVTWPQPMLAGALSPVTGSFFSPVRQGRDELLWPAVHAYNRWLVDFCAAAPGRRAGIAMVPLHDMDRAVQEVRWAREHGLFGGIGLPTITMVSGLPGYCDPYYEPLWNVCEELDMVINLHVADAVTDSVQMYGAGGGSSVGLYESFLFSRRPVWFMLLSGVFDRHPGLKVVVSENGLQWYPAMIRDIELVFNHHSGSPMRSKLKHQPRDYYARNIFLGGSLMQRYEAEMRHEIGLDGMTWGSDYPHIEGAFPRHRDVMRYILGGLPEDDIRQILGTNAVKIWGFDEGQLQAVADQTGPEVAELSTQATLADFDPTFSWSTPRDVPVQV